MLFDNTLSGSVKDCIKRIEEYIDAGVNHFLVHNFSADYDWSFEVLTKEVIPYFRSLLSKIIRNELIEPCKTRLLD